ncbi:Gamma-aminobutyric acid type B receptor subunit 2 [Holothuria leucospilota]|uniref:Gamma-aminobutyric acid type B receptor subunit 2 n=1 Tax=Holothuria leucospilota TaxID=206669 RepID=A0A9Q1HI89_HOLLE|nr:Gamma-aminobutyric acid type B receptor subunit 2 [Holothuria leucospilota]
MDSTTSILLVTLATAAFSIEGMTTPLPYPDGGLTGTSVFPSSLASNQVTDLPALDNTTSMELNGDGVLKGTTVFPSSLASNQVTDLPALDNASSMEYYTYEANTTDVEKIPVYLAGFFSTGERWDGSGMVLAADLAVDHVNESPGVLKGYELHIEWKDSKCNSADGIWQFYRHLIEEPKKIMLFGPPCSVDVEPVAETSHNANLVTLSYSASSPALSNRRLYPYFYRTYKTDIIFNLPRIWLLNHFNWTRFGSLSENHDLFALTNNDLFELLPRNEISVEVSEIFDGHVTSRQIEILKERDIRIFIVGTYENAARSLFCQVYKNQLYGKGYVWILPGWYAPQWWQNGDPDGGCTKDEMQIAVEESLYLSMEVSNLTDTPEEVTLAGISANQYQRQLREKMALHDHDPKYEGIKFSLSGLEPFSYDAVWAVALTLNRTVNELAKTCNCSTERWNFNDSDTEMAGKNCSCKRLEDFTYDDVELGSLLFQEMGKTNFKGVSGPISFPSDDRVGVSKIEQLQARCDDGWLMYNFSCYLFVNEQKNWNDARKHCQAVKSEKPSYLVSILSEEEFKFLQKSRTSEWFIGLKYDMTLEKLIWVDAPNKEVNWSPESFIADDVGVEHCYVWNIPAQNWKPYDCDQPHPFICRTRTDFEERIILTISSDGKKVGDPVWYHEFVWHDDAVPLDRTPPVEEGLRIGTYIGLAVCAFLGIVMALVFLIFNICARNHRFVKLSSPNMNNLIVAGCVLIYASICILGLDVVHPRIDRIRAYCMLRIWLISIGFVLGFGALFSKTWRVYRVSNLDKGAKRVEIRDSRLFGLVGVLLIVDVIILTLWHFIDPLFYVRVNLHDGLFVMLCNCRHLSVWASLLLVYKGVILVFGVFLAWETRNVKIPALNDSKSIGICIYNTMVICAVAVGMTLAFPKEPGLQYLTTSIAMIFCTTFTLLVVFVPKIVFVYKHPKADRKVSTTLSPSSPATIDSVVSANDEVPGSRGQGSIIVRTINFIKSSKIHANEDSKDSPKELPGTDINLNERCRKTPVTIIKTNDLEIYEE